MRLLARKLAKKIESVVFPCQNKIDDALKENERARQDLLCSLRENRMAIEGACYARQITQNGAKR